MNKSGKGPQVAGVILAGGPGKRMGGRMKAFLRVDGVRNVDRLLSVYRRVFEEIVLAVRNSETFLELVPGVSLVEDRIDARSSLTGIHAGLVGTKAHYTFVAACDAPFVREGVIRALLAEVQPDRDVIIPLKDNGRMEPLCAIYSKTCLEHISAQLAVGDCKIIRFFDKVRVHVVPVGRFKSADPGLVSFLNMNTPEDLEAVRKIFGETGTV